MFEILTNKLSKINKDFFKTGEVAKLLNESDAMIRVYCRNFSDYLGFSKHVSNTHRKFSKEQILKLRYILYLCRDNHLKYKEAATYLYSEYGENLKPVENFQENELVLKLSKSELDSIIASVVNKNLNLFKKELEEEIDKKHKEELKYLKESNKMILKTVQDFLITLSLKGK